MNNEILSGKRDSFISRFEKESNKIKRQVHFQSVLNMTDALLLIKNKRESESHKQLLDNYFQEVSALEFPIDKLSSLKLYNIYLFPISLYLMRKADFRSSANLEMNLIWGILLDIGLFWLFFSKIGFYFPVFTLFFVYRAYKLKKNAIRNNKYFNTYY